MKGLLLFAKYAFPPNKFQYCGPKDTRAIFDYLKAEKNDLGLRELLAKFEGAMPYLKLIAFANKIKDPFNEKVVEAYWIGNDLLDKVEEKELAENLKTRFKKRIEPKDYKWLMSKIPLAAKPFHGFHVFEIFTRTGLLKGDKAGNVLETMDNCRISWGKVLKISDLYFKVKYQPLIIEDGKLKLGQLLKKKISKRFAGSDLVRAKKGDWVSFHWGWVCDILTCHQKLNLAKYTQKYINLTNLTI